MWLVWGAFGAVLGLFLLSLFFLSLSTPAAIVILVLGLLSVVPLAIRARTEDDEGGAQPAGGPDEAAQGSRRPTWLQKHWWE